MDNEGARSLASNPVSNSNSKHINARHHFIRMFVQKEDLSVIHVGSEYQHADILKKSSDISSFAFHRDFVMNMS